MATRRKLFTFSYNSQHFSAHRSLESKNVNLHAARSFFNPQYCVHSVVSYTCQSPSEKSHLSSTYWILGRAFEMEYFLSAFGFVLHPFLLSCLNIIYYY